MNRPTSQPHSPSPHGLWSAQRLLQHLNQANVIFFDFLNNLVCSTQADSLFNILSSPFWSHTCDLYNQDFQSCWEISQSGTMTWQKQKHWQKKFHKNVKHKAPIETLSIAEHSSRFPGIVAWSLALIVVVACTGTLQSHLYRSGNRTPHNLAISLWYKGFP